jgi:hypothetical protein
MHACFQLFIRRCEVIMNVTLQIESTYIAKKAKALFTVSYCCLHGDE